MYTNKERIAIARIVSDMIKADNIKRENCHSSNRVRHDKSR